MGAFIGAGGQLAPPLFTGWMPAPRMPRATTRRTTRRSKRWWSRRANATSRWPRCPSASRYSPPRRSKAYNIQSFDDYATKTPNISSAHGGGPTGIADARTIAIRGITGQNLFGTAAGATGFYIDDTPVPESVDPRVLDIDNIEVVKGSPGHALRRELPGRQRTPHHQAAQWIDLRIGYTAQAGATSGGGSPDGGAGIISVIMC